MTYAGYRLAIPSNEEYSIPQLRFILKEVEFIMNRKIPADEWENLK